VGIYTGEIVDEDVMRLSNFERCITICIGFVFATGKVNLDFMYFVLYLAAHNLRPLRLCYHGILFASRKNND
jgi:hypothetical protein